MRMPHALLLTTTLAAYAAPAAAQERSDWLDIEKGKSIVLELPQVPRAISLTDSIVADIVQLGSPMRWQVQGKQIGTTDLVLGKIPPVPVDRLRRVAHARRCTTRPQSPLRGTPAPTRDEARRCLAVIAP